MLLVQVPEDHGASMCNGQQVNDHIEEDDHIDNIVEVDGINTLIHDSFNVRMHDDDGDGNENIDDFDDVHEYLFSIRHMNPFMKAPKKFFSFVLLIMNLKVMNGLSNISITWMLRYVK